MLHIREEVSLLPYNTFGVPATATLFVEADQAGDLVDFFKTLSDPSDVVLMGGGSNILFVSDRCALVVRPLMKGIELIDETDDHVLVRVGAGEVWDDFVHWCVEKKYAGVENLSHIPGLVGACPIQNIGAYGAEAKETVHSVESVEIFTGQTVSFNNQQCGFDYRDSFLKKNKGKYLITAVQFRLWKKFEANIKYADLKTELFRNAYITIDAVRRAIVSIRRRKLPDPADLGNAGSFFKNPTIEAAKSKEITQLYAQVPAYPISREYCKISAAWLIQQCGWLGTRSGHVGVHRWQPLVLVNYGGATGKEVLNFAGQIIDSVAEKFGIRLEPEVNIV